MRKNIDNKRAAPDRRRQDRRRARRRMRTSSVPLDQRSGQDRRRENRRGGIRRTSDTLSAKRRILERELRAKKR